MILKTAIDKARFVPHQIRGPKREANDPKLMREGGPFSEPSWVGMHPS